MNNLELEKKINEEITSDYWQKIIMFDSSVDCELEITNMFFNLSNLSVSYIYIYNNWLYDIEIPLIELKITSFADRDTIDPRIVKTKIVRKIIKEKIENEEIINSYSKEDVKAKSLYVETTSGRLYFKEVKDSDIYVDDEKVMHFGALGAVNLNNFISYKFVEAKENE